MKKQIESEEVITQEMLNDKIEEVLTEIVTAREAREAPTEGYKYKSDQIEKMYKAGELNLQYVIENVNLILLKKSDLNAGKRLLLLDIFKEGMRRSDPDLGRLIGEIEEQTQML
jgi:hypothetical protein